MSTVVEQVLCAAAPVTAVDGGGVRASATVTQVHGGVIVRVAVAIICDLILSYIFNPRS